ncbi:MAG: 5'/3'-nucleotidase SurE, partial [Phycisphaerales bacterium]|nr:5'/3'-nucleotidase SurE [Phycisphaerales bacterium]
MRILLTNDDGIRAPGLIALHDALRETLTDTITDLVVVAPLTVQSATSHGVTFHEPLMTRTVRASATVTGTAVDGRPADCTKLALTNLWPERFGEGSRPDLVVSGMNMGSNAGINVIYSGTVAAAIEAAFMGVPSIAVSM